MSGILHCANFCFDLQEKFSVLTGIIIPGKHFINSSVLIKSAVMGGTVEHLPNLNGYARGVKWQKFTKKLNMIRKFMNDGQRPKSLPPISQGQQGFSQSRSTILRYSN